MIRRSTVFFAMLAMMLALFSQAASATTYFSPYNNTPFKGSDTKTALCGWTEIPVPPYALTTIAKVGMATSSMAVGCGATAVNAWAGFDGPLFTADKTGPQTVEYKWSMNWRALLITDPCVSPWPPFYHGTNWAESRIGVYGNLWDVTAQAWKHSGDGAYTNVFEKYGSCGVSGAGNRKGQIVSVKFATNLVAGHRYMFRSYVQTHALTDAVGIVSAHVANDVGSKGIDGGAWLTSISLDPGLGR